ncbi:DNA repair-scaffolding protein [Archocentrus centrarchus]|uniref:DNA repair-scaffolding protein n=1 Tax=Archocentrus centrarchus TaxID=63155 RepID=UPI0011E9D94E|nr:DNA repair-scaffolding protein [Archocentrus centrarchus]
MCSRKRKRYSRDIKYVFFPDDVHNGLQKVGREPPSISALSSAKSWEKCGDSFLDSPVTEILQSPGRKLSAVRKLKQLPSVPSSGPHHDEDPVNIAWSSSNSEQSDNETQEQHLPRVAPRQQQSRSRARPTAPTQSYSRGLLMLSTDKDDLPVIDTDSDLDDESHEDVEKDSKQQISDCESSEEKPNDFSAKTEDVEELEISGYASNGEDSGSSSRLDSEVFPLQSGEGSKRSISDWVRSAQAMLQTPQKPMNRQPKTPEDSAKKKRKFQSGGLAERLNRLQCRQRSAISFWKHQSISDTSTATTATVDRPGVLVLEVLEVHEECSMQLAHCEHHQPPGDGHQLSNPVSEEKAHMLVLFNRETAAQLIPAPRDVIHLYPPWQSLSVEGFSCPVILNTHFSKKVFSASKAANTSIPRDRVFAERHTPYYLGKSFALLDSCRATDESDANQVAQCSLGGSGVLTRHCISLLEAIEGLGQAGFVEQDVEVVVQRVYSIHMADCSPVSILKPRVPLRSSTAPPAEKGKTRLCVLVQDSYGMFSVVQLHPLPCEDDLSQYCQMWQGKTCMLRGIKVVQRVTRERSSRLFSLIDSLWPPAMPLKDHGNSLSMQSESRPLAAALSFCYLLSGQQGSVEPSEDQGTSPLYLQPTKLTLRDILQSETETCRCTFTATVLYKRIQNTDIGQGEVWLVLTDPSLQEEQPERPCRRTVALRVNTSCVLTSSVLKTLNSPAVCHMLFRDAIKEHGVLLCAEQSVVEVCPDGCLKSTNRSEVLLQLLPEPQAKTLPQPVRLDPLSLETTPNSLCILTGVIVGVDESTAYSWPACNLCGNDNLELSAERPQNFHCASCKSVVDKPNTKIQLEVFLTTSSLRNCTMKVKLQQRTIMTILNAAELEGSEFPGYDVEAVLGKEVGPIPVYVRVITRKPALWMGLEEICL